MQYLVIVLASMIELYESLRKLCAVCELHTSLLLCPYHTVCSVRQALLLCVCLYARTPVHRYSQEWHSGPSKATEGKGGYSRGEADSGNMTDSSNHGSGASGECG